MIFKKSTPTFLRFLFLIVLTGLSAQTSDEGKFKSISIKGLSGAHIYSGESLNDKVNYGYFAMDVRFAWHPSQDNYWSRDTGFASYGIGFYTANVGDPQVFGNPTALYGFANFFLSKSSRRNVLELSPALGLTYHLEPYNPETNPSQDAIGARMAVYFNVNFGAAYKLTREMDILYGIDFTHYSNGRTFTPNYGLNLFGFNAGMRYNFNQLQKDLDPNPYTTNVVPARFDRPERPATQKNDFSNSIDLYAAIGTVQNDKDRGTKVRYGTFSGVLDYRHYFNRMHGATLGFDLFFDDSLVASYPESGDRFLLAAHAGYDFMFWRLAIRAQLGTYISDPRGKGNFFIRPALQYNISKNFFAQIGLKTKNGAAADWVEFGVGWRPFKW
jgi:hypothetical protein